MDKKLHDDIDNELETRGIPFLLFKYSTPAILNMLISVFYTFIDAVFLAWAIPDGFGITVVTLAMPLTLIIWAFALLIGQGGNALAAIYIGKKEIPKAEKCLGNCLILFIFISIILALVAIFFIEQLLTISAVPAYLISDTKLFVQIQFYGAIFFFISIGISNFLRSIGAPIYSFVVNLISIFVCIVTNWLLVLQFNMGVVGSSLATVIGQFIGAVLVILFFIISKKATIRIRIINIKFDVRYCRKILVMGLSTFVMSFGTIIIGIVFNWTVAYYGSLSPLGLEGAFATIGAVQRFIPLLYMPIVGISIGSQPIIGYNFGANRFDRVLISLRFSIIVSMVYGLFVTIICSLFAYEITSIFWLGDTYHSFAAYTLGLEVIFYVLVGFQIQGGSYFQSSGQPVKSMILESLRQIIILIPMFIILPYTLTTLGIIDDGLYAVVWCPPIADLLSFIITFIFVLIEFRKLKHRQVNISNHIDVKQ